MPKRSRHPGVNFYRRADGVVLARWRDPETGRTQYHSVRDMTPMDREHFLIDKSAELQRRKHELALGAAVRVHTPLAEAVERFVAHCRAESKSARTIEAYRETLTRFVAYLGPDTNTHSITARHLMDFKVDASKRRKARGGGKISPHSINRWLREVHAFIHWLKVQKLVAEDRDAISYALKQLGTTVERPEFLRPDECRALLSVPLLPLERAFLAVGLLTGCRLGELLGLRRANFFPSEHQLVVAASSSKRRQTRTIDLTLSPALERLLSAIPGDTTLFFPYQTSARARHIVNKAIRRGVPEFTPQTLRQTCATYTVAIRGASVESQQLGHQITVAQRHYVGLVARIDRVATLEAAMGVEAEVGAITQALRKG